MAACSLVSFSPTRTARASSARSNRKRASRCSNRFASRAMRLDSQPLEHGLVAAPVRPHLHDQLEIDLSAEDPFDLGPRAGAYRLDHGSGLPDQDAFLRLGLDVKARVQAGLVDVVDLHADRVWNLLARQGERLLAHELGELRLERQVRGGAFVEIPRPFGQQVDQVVPERLEALPVQRAHWVEGMEVAERCGALDLLGDLRRLY